LKEYDVYVPLTYSDGRLIETEKLAGLKDLLLGVFGGLTFFPQENEGYWRVGNVVFRDRIVIFRLLTDDVELAQTFLPGLKEQLKKDLEQEDILIVEKEARTV